MVTEETFLSSICSDQGLSDHGTGHHVRNSPLVHEDDAIIPIAETPEGACKICSVA